jgi:hypothetical protein
MGPMIRPGAQAGCLVLGTLTMELFREGYLGNCLMIFDPGNFILDLLL